MIRYATVVTLGTLALAAAGCQPESEEPPAEQGQATQPATPEGASPAESAAQATAVAHLEPADASSGISGTVRFTQESNGVRVRVEVSGLTPGNHGFHIHENGECAPPFESAGDHLNPYDLEHACPPEGVRHLGDLGNIEVGPDGTGSFEQVIDKISLVDPAHQIAGRAVVIHGGEDDCASQPAGDSGERVACGVIQASSHSSGGEAPADHQVP